MHIKYLLVFFVSILHNNMYGQSVNGNPTTEKIKWDIPLFTDLSSNVEIEKGVTFITNVPEGKVEWIQKNGAVVYEMKIYDIVGDWNNITNNGSVVFRVRWENRNGTLEAGRQNGNLYLTLDINPSGKDRLYFKYTVTSYKII